jgi:hypothetical protein
MRGVQPRTLTNRELIRHCANLLELTRGGLPYEVEVELLRRFIMKCSEPDEPYNGQMPLVAPADKIDPEAD